GVAEHLRHKVEVAVSGGYANLPRRASSLTADDSSFAANAKSSGEDGRSRTRSSSIWEDTIGHGPGPVELFKVSKLFSFFETTLHPLVLPSDATDDDVAAEPLLTTLSDLETQTHRRFLDAWEAQAQAIRSTSTIFQESHTMLSGVKCKDTQTEDEQAQAELFPILAGALDPLLQFCQQISTAMAKGDAPVFMLNCLVAMQTPLLRFPFTSQRVTMLHSLIEDQMNSLIREHSESTLRQLGLAEILVRLAQGEDVDPMTLSACFRGFYTALFNISGTLSIPVIDRLGDRSLRSQARQGVGLQITDAYEKIYNYATEHCPDIRACHTPESVRALLDV
ncbi:Golgi transport complex subunit 6, partial [Perkinsus olseni]